MAKITRKEVFEEMCRDFGGTVHEEGQYGSQYLVCDVGDDLDDLKAMSQWLNNIRKKDEEVPPLMVTADLRFADYHEVWEVSVEPGGFLVEASHDKVAGSPMGMHDWILERLKERGIPEDEAEDIAVNMDYREIFDETADVQVIRDAGTAGFLVDDTDLEIRQDHVTDNYVVKSMVNYEHPEHAVLSHALDQIDDTLQNVAEAGAMRFHDEWTEEFEETLEEVQ